MQPAARAGRRRGLGPRGVLDRVERPVAFQPGEDCVVKDRVERGAVGPHPGPDGRPPPPGAVRLLAAGRVDVHAADDVAGADVNSAVLEAQPAVVLTQFEISVAAARQAMQTGREIGALTVCNASPALDLPMLDGVDIDVLVVNRNEAKIMSGRKQLSEAAERMAQRTGGTVIVTLGGRSAGRSTSCNHDQHPCSRCTSRARHDRRGRCVRRRASRRTRRRPIGAPSHRSCATRGFVDGRRAGHSRPAQR